MRTHVISALGTSVAIAALAACGAPSAASSEQGSKVEAKAAKAGGAYCRGMKDPSFVPAGWHVVTARWEPDSTFGDTVCIAKTEGKEIQFLAWHGMAQPAGYYTLYKVDSGVDTTFRGCAQWTEWQGRKDCSVSWTMYRMRRND